MSADSGDDLYIIQALLDIVSDSEVITRSDLFNRPAYYGFFEFRINQLLDRLNVRSQANLAYLSKIDYKEFDYKFLAVTHPAYYNYGIPAKNLYSKSVTFILESIQDIIYNARNRTLTLSPYAEDDELNYLCDSLVMKLKSGVEVKLIVRELNDDTPRRNKLIRWINDNLSMYDNFTLYNNHYVSSSGHIDSKCYTKVVVSDNGMALSATRTYAAGHST